MLAAQKEAYLSSLADDGWYPDFWVSKLHFYISGLPFYNFPYTFGYLLSTGLYALSQGAGDEISRSIPRVCWWQPAAWRPKPRYNRRLDMTWRKREFWEKSLDVIERRVGQFLELVL